jgi:hypothetical protein
MLYMAMTEHVQADESIDCNGIAEVDAASKPWALLLLGETAATAEAGWRLVGAYAAESDALAAHRRLSQSLKCGDYDALSRPKTPLSVRMASRVASSGPAGTSATS